MFSLFSFRMMFRDVLDLSLSTRHLCFQYNTATTASTEEERIIIERTQINQQTILERSEENSSKLLVFDTELRFLEQEMRDEGQIAPSSVANGGLVKKEASDGGIFGRGKYKFWALVAILLLAFWSMFTGTVTLKWSSGNLSRVSDDFDSRIHKDLDILEVEDKEKVVKHMWDVYTQSRKIKLPIFWQEAFKAAYEDLTSEVPSVRENALSEIAKMFLVRSTFTHELEPPPVESNHRYY